MARILVHGEWYEEFHPSSVVESELQALVCDNAAELFPDFHTVRFEALVESDTSAAKPDLALIDKCYREWWVVELEKESHPFDTHVLPQVRTLVEGIYGAEHAEYLHRQAPSLSLSSLLSMVKGAPPSVLVMVDTPRPDWERDLALLGVRVGIFQVFRSDTNKCVFRVNGYRPTRTTEAASTCALDNLITSWLRVHSPAGLGVSPHESVKLRYDERVTIWQLSQTGSAVWLKPQSGNPFKPRVTYELIRVSDGSFDVRLLTPPRRDRS